MELTDYIRVVKTYWKGLVACVLAGLLVGGTWASLQPKEYVASGSAALIGTNEEGVTTLMVADNATKSLVKAYLDIAKSRPVAEFAQEKLGLDASVDELIASVRVTNPIDTAILRINATNAAAEVARDLVEAWIEGMALVVRGIEGPPRADVSSVRLESLNSTVLPQEPTGADMRLALLSGLIAGGAIGFAYAVMRGSVDRRIRAASDVTDEFDAPVLGVIPAAKIWHKFGRGKTQLAQAQVEAFRHLCTNLRFQDGSGAPKVVVVSSCVKDDGKSAVALKLAEAIAEAGQRVVLIEADLRLPKIANELSLAPAPGLAEVLAGAVPASAAVQAMPHSEDMFVLPAGNVQESPMKLLSSPSFDRLLESLGQNAVIVIDVPPLLAVADGANLVPRVDGVVLVTRAGETKRDELKIALESVTLVNGRVFGVAVTGVKGTRIKSKYFSRVEARESALV